MQCSKAQWCVSTYFAILIPAETFLYCKADAKKQRKKSYVVCYNPDLWMQTVDIASVLVSITRSVNQEVDMSLLIEHCIYN